MKHMEEMKIAGLAMALCIVMLGIYIVVPKDGTVSHLTAIPDNNAAGACYRFYIRGNC